MSYLITLENNCSFTIFDRDLNWSFKGCSAVVINVASRVFKGCWSLWWINVSLEGICTWVYYTPITVVQNFLSPLTVLNFFHECVAGYQMTCTLITPYTGWILQYFNKKQDAASVPLTKRYCFRESLQFTCVFVLLCQIILSYVELWFEFFQ